MYKSSIIMYPIVFDCIRLYHMGCHHVKSCQDGTDLAYFLQLQTRTTCIGLLECTCRFSFHCHPLRGLAHCVCVCVVGVSPRKIQASCVCTVTKSEWRVFFGLPDSPSLSSFFSCQHCWYVWKSSSRAWQDVEWALLYPRGGPGFSPYDWTQWNLQCPGHLRRTETIHGLSFSGWWGRRTSTEQLGFAMLQLYWRQSCIGKCMRLYAFVCVCCL
jgi:hypothetical protein